MARSTRSVDCLWLYDPLLYSYYLFSQSFRVLGRALSLNLKPDVITYNSLMHKCAVAGMWEKAVPNDAFQDWGWVTVDNLLFRFGCSDTWCRLTYVRILTRITQSSTLSKLLDTGRERQVKAFLKCNNYNKKPSMYLISYASLYGKRHCQARHCILQLRNGRLS